MDIVRIEESALTEEVNRFVAELPASTRKTTKRALKFAAEYLSKTKRNNVLEYDADNVCGFVRHMMDSGVKRKSVDTYLSCLSSLYRHMSELSGDSGRLNPFKAIRDTEFYRHLPTEDHRAGRALPIEQVESMFKAIDSVFDSSVAYKVRIALALGFLLGKRVSTIVSVSWNDYDGLNLKTTEKGSREHTVVVPEKIRALLDESSILYGDSGRIVGYTANTIRKWLSKLSKHLGIKTVNPHDMRRTFATRAVCSHTDIAIVSQWMGHKSIKTTELYLRESAVTDEKNIPQFVNTINIGE